jgi:hypothetical protein
MLPRGRESGMSTTTFTSPSNRLGAWGYSVVTRALTPSSSRKLIRINYTRCRRSGSEGLEIAIGWVL